MCIHVYVCMCVYICISLPTGLEDCLRVFASYKKKHGSEERAWIQGPVRFITIRPTEQLAT